MHSDEKSYFFMVGNVRIMVHTKWIGFEYANRKGAKGWSVKVGFFHFYGERSAYGHE